MTDLCQRREARFHGPHPDCNFRVFFTDHLRSSQLFRRFPGRESESQPCYFRRDSAYYCALILLSRINGDAPRALSIEYGRLG